MPYPNNLDIYDYELAIKQAEILYNSANGRKKFYEKRLKQATQYFKRHKNKTLKFGVVVTILDKKNDTKRVIDSRGEIPDTTHGLYYKEDYELFISKIKDAISELWWNVEMENEIAKCEKEKTLKKKLCAFVALKKKYEEFLQNSEFMLKDCNPEAYEKDKTLYNEQIQIINKRIKDLLDRKGFFYYIKRIFKASKIKPPFAEIDFGKIIE